MKLRSKLFHLLVVLLTIFFANGPIGALAQSRDGGANAHSGKLLESHIWHPEESKAFEIYLKDIYKNAFGYSTDLPETSDIFNSFKFKTWYKLKAKLPDVGGDILGVTYPENQNQQVAIQRKENIQFDENIFDAIDLEEQAKSILHETIMLYYFLNFMNSKEIIIQSKLISPIPKKGDRIIEINPKLTEFQLVNYSFEEPRMLSSSDYENIRSLTEWLFKNGKKISQNEFERKALSYGFSFFRHTVTTNDQELTNPKSIDMSNDDLKIAIEKTQFSGELEQQICFNIYTQIQFNCKIAIDFTNKNVSSTQVKISIYNLDIINNIKKTEVSSVNFNLKPQKLYIDSMNLTEQISYSYKVHDRKDDFLKKPSLQKGDVNSEITLMFSQNGDRLIGIRVLPSVFVGQSNADNCSTYHYTFSKNSQKIVWNKNLKVAKFLSLLDYHPPVFMNCK